MPDDVLRPDALILGAVARAATDGLVVSATDGTIIEFNGAAERIFGRTRADVIGRKMLDVLVPPTLQEAHRAAVARHRTNLGTLTGAMRFRTLAQHSDGSTAPVDISLSTVVGADEHTELVISFVRDRIELQRDIRAEIATHADLPDEVAEQLTAAPVIVFSLDRSGVIEIFAGGGHTRIGSRDAAAIGRRVYAISPNPDEWDTIFQRAVSGEQFRTIIEVAGQCWDTHFHPVRNEAGEPTGSLAIGVDTTSQLVSEHALRVLAETDSVTGLSNRRHAESRLADLLAHHDELALLLIDLDNFKDINDTHGHAVGDAVLAILGKRLAKIVPTGAALGRLGGDELVIGLPTDEIEQIARIADDVLGAIAEPIQVAGQHAMDGIPIDINITASIGIATAPADGDTVSVLLARADSAMYAAKGSGRATRRFYHAFTDQASRRLEVGTKLRGAIAAGAIDVEFQPIYDLADGRVVGFETLARWRDPDLGVISPDEFIALAGSSPLIDDLFEVVMAKALAAMVEWNAAAGLTLDSTTSPPGRSDGGAAITVGLNVAARQLRDPRLPARIVRAAETAGVAPHCIVLELTETALMDAPARTSPVLSVLAEAGVRLVIDDYGVGYSNMARLNELCESGQLDAIKIDRIFIADLPDTRAEALFKMFLTMTEALGVNSIAEGIETAEQLETVRALGGRSGQGWFLGRPMSRADAVRLIAAETNRQGSATA